MPIDFPNSPTLNDTYSAGGRTWSYNGTTWVLSAYVGVVPDGSVDTAQIANSAVTSAKIANSAVTSAKIENNTIVNEDINSAAAIALSKLASGTGGQVVLANTTGVPTYTTVSGHISLAANGNASINSNSEVTFATVKTTGAIEPLTISATAATGTIALDAANGTTYYTSNASANWVVNLRWNSSTTLDSKLAIGEMATTTFMVRQGTTAYYPTSVQVNGTTSGVTTRWQGGTAPTSGNASSTDMYTFTAVKTASATFDVFAAQTRFA
jgi:hypothetical protein